MTNSSNPEYVLPSTASEGARLEAQGARLYGGSAFLEPFVAEEPRRVLDVGCGTGLFSRFVAGRLGGAEVVGVDADEDRLELGRQRARLPNLELRKGRIEELPFEDGRFDLVFSRFVLVHVPSPDRAIREMVRVAAPGGRVVAYDMVHDGIWFSPNKPAFAETLQRVISIMRGRGLEPSQGLHLATSMIGADLQDVRVQVIPHVCMGDEPIFEDYTRNWVDTLGGLFDTLDGLLDEDLVERALAELVETTPEELLIEMSVLATGTKA